MKKRFDLEDFIFSILNEKISLSVKEKKGVRESRKTLEKILEENPRRLYYGINTGVGALLNKVIPKEKLEEFQKNLIRSHSCGIGDPLDKNIVRGMMLHMILNLKKGYSGIRLETLELLIEMFNRDLIPVVPEVGSVGASGDLVPQAHIALALIGEGEILYGPDRNRRTQAIHVFLVEGLKPAKLKAGEAIALLNGTSLMTSYLAWTVFRAEWLIQVANIAAAMAIVSLGGSIKSFDERIQELRPHFGQKKVAQHILYLLEGAREREPHTLLQDAYSLRCVPQVHGPIQETILRARDIIEKEINSFCGNPVVFEKEVCQGSGNFHGQILAQLSDELSISLTNLSAISERRIERLLNPKLSGLPPFLIKGDETNSGLMVAQYTAAALVAENKVLASPASIHSISVSAGQEDFVSMGAFAARKVWQICKNTEYVVAIEILCALQALEFCSKVPKNIEGIQKIFRTFIPVLEKDRILAKDIEEVFSLIFGNQLKGLVK